MNPKNPTDVYGNSVEDYNKRIDKMENTLLLLYERRQDLMEAIHDQRK